MLLLLVLAAAIFGMLAFLGLDRVRRVRASVASGEPVRYIIFMYMNLYMYIYVCVYVYTHTHICIYTCIYKLYYIYVHIIYICIGIHPRA